MVAASWVSLVAPLAGALTITLLGTRISRRTAAYLSTLSVAVSGVAAAIAFFEALSREPDDRRELSVAWTWLSAGSFHVDLSILVDPLSLMMSLIVAGVGSLIVAYSIGYMDGEDEERRFFAYMAFFVFSMLLLVFSGNFLLLLAGWGLVGLSSYLLIGFYHERPSAIAAAKKAFIMNAAGDAAMALAFFVLIYQTGTLNYAANFAAADGFSSTTATLVALGLLAGAVAKSAQIPLQTWLPDAMEGPTPVSALIHAATMVTAGVYLVVRCHPMFEAAPFVQNMAAGIGALTLLVAGLVALVQTDIKRVIAYSTMSQIGYMFVGVGIGAYSQGMFLLMAHAFFKALLFLGAGIVIHALTGEQDMRKMGGLGRLLPWTYRAMLIGALALAGMPPLAGFFAKDSILGATIAREDWWGALLFTAGVLGAVLTGLYAFRMIFIVFTGAPSAFAREHLHRPAHGEAPFSMGSTVAVLAVLSIVGGWIQIPGLWQLVTDWLEPVAFGREQLNLVEASSLEDWLASLAAVLAALVGITVAWLMYGSRRVAVPRVAPLQHALEHKFYFDEAYAFVFYRPADALGRFINRWIEGPVFGGSITGLAAGFRDLGRGLSEVQTGFLRTYALAIAGGAAVLALVFVSVR